jgi:hypothetical protein
MLTAGRVGCVPMRRQMMCRPTILQHEDLDFGNSFGKARLV